MSQQLSNVMMVTSGTVYDQMCLQIAENNQALRALNKEIDRMNSENLKRSVQMEGLKRKLVDLESENATLNAVIGHLKGIAKDHMEMFEQIFDSDERSFQYTDMRKYLDLADFMHGKGWRMRKENIVRRVNERMNELPFGDA